MSGSCGTTRPCRGERRSRHIGLGWVFCWISCLATLPSAPEVEHRLVDVRLQVRIHRRPARIVEQRRIGRTDELSHLERWNRRLPQPGNACKVLGIEPDRERLLARALSSRPSDHGRTSTSSSIVGSSPESSTIRRSCRASSRETLLPQGYGVGFDERVVEFPWVFAQGLRGRVLDAGSALNHEHIVDRALRLVDELHVVTLEPEERAFTERRVSYVYADLRDLPYKDAYFDTVVCISTLEHVGMENARYGVTDPRSDDPVAEMSRAIAELARVSAGPMLLSVPYGRREDHGWFRQLDGADVETLLDAVRQTGVRHRLPLLG